VYFQVIAGVSDDGDIFGWNDGRQPLQESSRPNPASQHYDLTRH
jgi:hypothetical protein